jgi:DNA-binding NarL/FixJ family response regulator
MTPTQLDGLKRLTGYLIVSIHNASVKYDLQNDAVQSIMADTIENSGIESFLAVLESASGTSNISQLLRSGDNGWQVLQRAMWANIKRAQRTKTYARILYDVSVDQCPDLQNDFLDLIDNILTDSESKIIHDVIAGYNDREIADRFSIHDKTVWNHKHSARKKLRSALIDA